MPIVGRTALVLLCLFLQSPVAFTEPAAPPPSPEQLREELAYTLGVQAYIYGFPVVEMYKTRSLRVNDPKQDEATLNQFIHFRRLRDHRDRAVVSPNNDTLYSSAWLDLAPGPVVLSVPDAGGRYRVFQFLDFWTNNFASIGKRTNGSGAADYAVVGPGWQGDLPRGLKRIDAPTNAVWLLGRTLVDGPDDLAAVHALQDQSTLTPLAAWGKTNPPPTAAPPKPIPFDLSDPLKFFEFLNAGLRENPPPPRDAGLMALFGPINVGPDKPFRADQLDAATAQGLRRAVETGRRLVEAGPVKSPPPVNGWHFPPRNVGNFGDDYLLRATTAMKLLGALPPEEAVYPTAQTDDHNQPLDGMHRYVLRFEKGQAPPADAFWSVTLYRLPDRLLADNPLGRYSIGDRTKGLAYGTDGSLELYIQRDSPGKDRESNWLPAPEGPFCLTLRAYLPRKELLAGTWKVPAVRRVD